MRHEHDPCDKHAGEHSTWKSGQYDDEGCLFCTIEKRDSRIAELEAALDREEGKDCPAEEYYRDRIRKAEATIQRVQEACDIGLETDSHYALALARKIRYIIGKEDGDA